MFTLKHSFARNLALLGASVWVLGSALEAAESLVEAKAEEVASPRAELRKLAAGMKLRRSQIRRLHEKLDTLSPEQEVERRLLAREIHRLTASTRIDLLRFQSIVQGRNLSVDEAREQIASRERQSRKVIRSLPAAE